MAHKAFNMSLAVVIMAIILARTLAQPNCMPAIVSLSPCLGFISGNSSTPSSACCTQFASTVQTQPQCLCNFVSGAPQLPFAVNQTLALALPGACKVQAPPFSQCNAAGAPQAAPAPAASTTPSAASAPSTPKIPSNASPTTPSTPSIPSVPSGSGSKTVPKTGSSSSASTKFAPSILFLLFLASAISSF